MDEKKPPGKPGGFSNRVSRDYLALRRPAAATPASARPNRASEPGSGTTLPKVVVPLSSLIARTPLDGDRPVVVLLKALKVMVKNGFGAMKKFLPASVRIRLVLMF